MIDIFKVLQELAVTRPIFHSEADFQHALAWEIQRKYQKVAIRLEYPIQTDEDQMHLDVWVHDSDYAIGIELKYKTRLIQTQIGTENFSLKKQSGQPVGRYDFVKDICRLEKMQEADLTKGIDKGYAVFLSNDSSYWEPPKTLDTKDKDFRFHEGMLLRGEMQWNDAGQGTRKNREAPLHVTNDYLISWHEYSDVGSAPNSNFRYTVVEV